MLKRWIPSPKFNKEQCEYLAHKLKVVVQSASLFVEESRVERHGPSSSEDMAKSVEIFKLFLVEIESFIQGCCKDAWIQAAMTLTNVSEHVSSLGFNLELCQVAFFKESSATGNLTLNQVNDINKAEVEIVQKKASEDVATLLAKVALELNSLSGENRVLASYLLQRLLRVQPNPASNVDDDERFLGKLFQLFQPGERLGRRASGAVYEATWRGTPVAKKTFQGRENLDLMKEVGILAKLCHPNIMPLFCCGKAKRRCSIIVELMDDLHDLMYSTHQKRDVAVQNCAETVKRVEF